VRASDAEREEAVERLREAAGEGRLTTDELSERIELAHAAVTREELANLVHDLPSRELTPVPGRPVRSLGDISRSGTWIVPRESDYRSWMGHIRLDLRNAQLDAHEVAIRVFTLFGTVDVLVPEGVVVDARVRTAFGQLRQEAGDAAPPGAPRIILTGRSVFGTVRIRHRKLWEKLARLVS
jgi:hypothetical protein